jgi:hypothetical protein
MKIVVLTLAITSAVNAFSGTGIICREDLRLAGGSLKELILTNTQGGFVLQSQHVPALNAPTQNETWAESLKCRIDEKSPLAFCESSDGKVVAQAKDVRELLYDSLDVNIKKKTNRQVDITLRENGLITKQANFAANQCRTYGSEVSLS